MRDVCKYKIPYVISFALLLIAILVIGYERCSRASITWTYDTESCKFHYFEIIDDVLYVTYPFADLHAIDTHTGKLKWEYTDRDCDFSRCTVVDGVVYLVRMNRMNYKKSEGLPGGNYLSAIDSAHGEPIWHFKLDGHRWGTHSKPTIVDGIVYLASLDNYVYAYVLDSRELLWRFLMQDDVRTLSSISVADGRVSFYTPGYFCAVDAATGELELQWGYNASFCEILSAAEADGVAYIFTYDHTNYNHANRNCPSCLYAIDVETGELKWKYEKCSMGRVSFPPAIVDGVIYFGCDKSYVYALDTDTGELIWRHRIRIRNEWRPRTTTTPTVVNDILYAGCNNKNLYAFDAKKGKVLWRLRTEGPIFSSIIVEDDVIYFGSSDGYLYAIETNGRSQEQINHDE